MNFFGLFEITTTTIIFFAFVVLAWLSIKTIRQTERGLVERFGKYNRYVNPGITFIIPLVEELVTVNITEQMVDADSQEIITKDNLNAKVDAQIYFKVNPTEENVKASQYNVDDYTIQIVSLARTTLRNIIGQMPFKDVNSEREKLNIDLGKQLDTETKTWGISIVRSELKEIIPPQDVQNTMNQVIKAENEKTSAVDFATAKETQADGTKRAIIREAEGNAQAIQLRADAEKKASILKAEGEAKAIQLVNESAEKYFKGNAVELKKLETLSRTFKKNTKVVVSSDLPMMELVSKIADLKQGKAK